MNASSAPDPSPSRLPATQRTSDVPRASTPSATGKFTSLTVGLRPLPEYQLVRRLGEGGFGEVWEAIGPGGIPLALKFLRLEATTAATELRALEAVKKLRHGHLLTLFGFWQLDPFLMIAMELADGTLADRLKQARGGVLPERELLRFMHQAAQGIDYLNQWNVQHRDIKPQNLLLVGGTVKVGDYGLAKVLEQTVATASGKLTPSYAAPEFFEGQATRWSDQYSLAVSYCQLRGGRLPFEGNPVQVMAGHVTQAPDLSMIPEAERKVVARALAKQPQERWPDCGAFVKAVTEASTVTIPDIPDPGQPHGTKTSRRRGRTLGLIVAFTAFLIANGIGLLWLAGKFSEAPTRETSGAKLVPHLVVPEKVTVLVAGQTKLPLWVERNGVQGRVEITMDGLPPNVQAIPLTLEADQDHGEMKLSARQDAQTGTYPLRLKLQSTGESVASAITLVVTVDEALEAKVIAAIQAEGGSVTRDDNRPGKPVIEVQFTIWTDSTPGILIKMQALSELQKLDLSKTSVSDAGLQVVGKLPNLRELRLYGCEEVSDEGLKHLQALSRLETLDLNRTKVSDKGVKLLQAVSQLQTLDLCFTKVSDDGLKHLQAFSRLRTLDLGSTKVSDEGLKHLQALSQLQTLNLSFTKVSNAGLQALGKLTNLRELDLHWCKQVSDEGLKQLQALCELQTLDLSDNKVSDEGLKQLQVLSQLQTLNLGSTSVSNAGLEAVSKLTNLRHLRLYDCKQVNDEGLKHLQALSQLQKLDLSKTSVSNAGLEAVSKLTNLRDLRLYDCKEVKDEGLKHLQALSQLQMLDLSFTNVSDEGVKHLQALSRLQKLDLQYAKVSNAGLQALGKLTNLCDLRLDNCKEVGDEGVKHLQALSQLHTLNLSDTKVSNAGLQALGKLTNLRELRLSHCREVGDEGLKQMQSLSQLHTLDLSLTSVNDEGLKKMQALSQLQTLDLGYTKVSNAGLQVFGKLTNLRELRLSHCREVSDEGLKQMQSLSQLQTLNLSHTSVSDEGLKHLQALSRLQWLDLSSTKVSDEGLKHLQALSRLRTLDLSSTKVSDEEVKQLKSLSRLQWLTLTGTKVTDPAIAELKKVLPEVLVIK